MAATVSSPWGKPGAWALDAEEHEAELQQQQQEKQNSTEIADFPSLAAAAAATKPKKKNKGQTFSLAEFNSAPVPAKMSQPKGLTHEDLLLLPTGPRERSVEELDRSRLGGGFKSYGSNSRYGSNNSGDDSSNSRWGSGGSSSRVSNKESNRELQPSRADEIDNWAAAKKSVTPTGRNSGGFFDSQSKADESDSWISNKTEITSRSRFGFERKSSFDSLSRDRERDNWGRKKEESTNDSEALRARPKLVLQPRTVPVSEGGASPSGNVAKPKGTNPFGEARPREQVLAEKGKDWKEIDEKLEAVKIKEEKSDATSVGRRGFGNSRAGFAETRSWRKNESDSVDATQESAENGQGENKSENGHTEESSDNGHTEEN